MAKIYRRPVRKRLVPLLAAILIVSACAGSEEATTTSAGVTSPVPPSTSTTIAVTTTTIAVSTSTKSDATTTTTQEIDVHWEGGQVVGPDRFEYTLGEQVSIWVLSDADEEIHVHSYDVTFNAKAGIPLEVSLVADVPGIFEVELEETHTLLFELEVTS